MKKQILKRVSLILLALLLCVSSFAGCGNQEATEPGASEQQETFVQLLGFDSYDELTGAKIAIGHMLGKMEINTDSQYITQGAGSLKVYVQGDYGDSARNPYFKLDFLNTSMATCDFTKFKSISFDVYNASDKDLHIRANINVGKEDGNYIGAAKETYTLKANSWTTCTYDLSKMAGFTLYDFSSVRYMTVEFLEHKESRDGVPNVFYIDNLIGAYFAEGEEPEEISFDFYEGIDFETAGTELLFTGQGKSQDASFERVSYDRSGIDAPKDGGTYALRLSHENNYWPTFRINFGKELPAGTEISFEAYGRINGESLYNQSIFEFSDGGDATVQFNCDAWTQLSFTLKTAGSYVDLFWNYDRAQVTSAKASGEVFIDNMVAKDPVPPIEPEGNFWDGLDFEIPGNAGLFVGQKIEGNERRDAAIERVAYADLDIPALENGGEYALKLSHDSNYWPTFRINFGEKLPKGTIITFQAYARITSGTSNYNQSIFEFSAGGEATDQFKCDAWTELSMKLPENAEYIDLFWNYDRAGITSGSASAEVYIDNVIATPGKAPIAPVGDFYEGLDFEIIGNVGYFVGQGDEKTDAVINWASYDNANIPALSNGGKYLMKLSHDSFYWPAFRMNFGKELPAGTKITFMAYGTIKGETLHNQSIFEFTGGGEATAQFKCDQWTELTITLPKAASYIDLFWNYDRASVVSSASGAVYIDNMIAIAPIAAEGDFLEGVGFEVAGNAALFAGIGENQAATIERVSYADANVTAPANGGSYALKVSHTSNCWPNFRVNFGKTLKAGTTITFDVYGNYDYAAAAGENKYMKLELTADSKNFAASEDPNQVLWTLVETWKTGVIITLTADSDHVDFFYNVADGQHGEVASWLLMDNFLAVEPTEPSEPEDPVGDITDGLDFETADQEQLIAGTGDAQAATIERVSYTDANVTAPANGGSYALKVSHTNNCWPSFRVNFGKTLKAGTTITFDVYGNYDYAAAAGENKYVKLELTADSKNFATSEDPNQVVWTLVETWKTGVTITLTADSDHVDFFYNVADGQHGEVASWLLMDNFLAVESTEPSEPEDPVGDITDGLDFETADQEQLITGTGAAQDATIERVTYADANVTAPANGGSYALKVSHTSHNWPSFRVNFGKTLKAGTTVTFDVYGNYDYAAPAGVNKYVKLELTADSKNFAASEDPNQVLWTLVETWKTGVTITLTADSDHVDFFYNVADGQHGEVASWLLMDNFLAVEPSEPEDTVGDITDGLDFETADQEQLITGTGDAQDATIERVSYADANVTAPENGGSYALKVSHTSHNWPSFRVNFGKTLKAGTTITFDVYGNYDYAAPAGVNKYMKLELAASSKSIAKSEDSNQVVWTLVETWKTGVTITLTADSDHVDFFYNVADGQHGEVSSWLLLDNIKAVEPGDLSEPEDSVGGITDGLDFETVDQEQLITGTGDAQDATIKRVSYADANVTAPANGGSYALKVSHTSHNWPSFRVNFGKTLKAGTTITFDVYGNYDYAAPAGVYKYMKLELAASSKSIAKSEDSNQVVWTLVETWKTGMITLTADSDHVDFFYNVADGQHGEVASWLLLDNIKAVEPGAEDSSGEQMEKLDFEKEADAAFFTGLGISGRDAAIERVTYADLGVAAPANGGSYALKLSHADNYWPTFRINFGKTLKAGTTVTFMAYGKITSGTNRYNQSIFEFFSGGEATVQFKCDQWTALSITLSADADHMDLFWNYDRAGITSATASGEVYIDNMVVEPATE